MLRAALAATLATGLLLPASALADGQVTGRDRAGDVKAKGLSAKERRALDIVSVTARGDRSAGLMVTVKFRGNFQKAMGRGHLKRGLAALVMRPAAKGKRPTGILTTGAGKVGTTLRRTASDDVGVVREGRSLTFFVTGRALEGIKTIEVKAFARRPRRARSSQELESASDWLLTAKADAADAERITAFDLKKADCPVLQGWQAAAKDKRASLERDGKWMGRLRDEIIKAQQEIENRSLFRSIGKGLAEFLGAVPPGEEAGDLAVALRLVDRAIVRNKEARENLLRFEGKIDGLLSERCKQQIDTVVGPPVIKQP